MRPQAFYAEVSREELQAAIERTGTPAYLVFGRIVERRLAELRACLGPRFTIHFAVKANPHPELLRFLAAAASASMWPRVASSPACSRSASRASASR